MRENRKGYRARARAAQKGGVGRAAAADSLEESLFHARTDVPTDDAIKRPFVKAPSPLCAFVSIFPPGCEKKDDNVPPLINPYCMTECSNFEFEANEVDNGARSNGVYAVHCVHVHVRMHVLLSEMARFRWI